ncbi:MAG: hypothetical protein CVT92_11155 [Bacteroidetes bacterium HGW-Bacteroidetes-1]|jgi:hypothetical protein|nr:MAG: hypothetical protein CVT92_11155 [Bacteroidetes bacterium HGW-Bacteroidetes-1]
MKNLSFKINKEPQQIIEQLKSEISKSGTFTLNIKEEENEILSFNLRKRIQFGEQILHRNLVIVKGEISRIDRENCSKVDISFKQNPLVIISKIILFGLGLISILTGFLSSTSFIIPGIILLAIGFILWFSLNKSFKDNSEKYRVLLSELLEI